MIWLMAALDYAIALVVVEVVVTLLESLGYRWIASLSWRRALSASCVANGASTGLGLALYVLHVV